ncbi:glycosyltransferase family 2 protein [Rubrivivax benzoatilyticus]|uniref:Glycosyltransferase family 2 protein n=1 Tax=Rubrivivax benzoatilyticus TaxID=316997 RepID=A0ABX0HZZ6_9BURK|nr:glycosyltransferase family 2 protein [Rubrivivax benzoatilyticus]EGJ09794.1 glycosyl transferase family protein [Rubrivivax benzoatilyticus JA2 = ATCC BAA-35]MCD0423666.1 glycosyltransferase [Rubrivivax sp. JA1024]NHK99409.1 glycosyltransferase family 2 protein [Rubrivivax benzoatilyticus]NHL25283.1 glycosyltransferase family 2 protein [Rubrivivax benzoatilyticus]
MPPTPFITVVIPFFQREPGILARTLRSVATVGYPLDRLQVLVVDDESPWPACDELATSPPPQGLVLRVIRQANGGPGAARNTGLAHLPAGTELVAFIDSDDEWMPGHLDRAVNGLSAGFNAYFANLHHPGETQDEFAKSGRIEPSRHPAIGSAPGLHAYQGDIVHQITTANVIYMTTLVIVAAELGSVRFQESFRRGGEDYLYWLDLDAAGARFAFSSLPGARRGIGVNLWDSNGWGSDGLARRIHDEARYRQLALQRYARSDQTRTALRQEIRRLRSLMVHDALHRLRRGKALEWSVIWRMLRDTGPSSGQASGLPAIRPQT